MVATSAERNMPTHSSDVFVSGSSNETSSAEQRGAPANDGASSSAALNEAARLTERLHYLEKLLAGLLDEQAANEVDELSPSTSRPGNPMIGLANESASVQTIAVGQRRPAQESADTLQSIYSASGSWQSAQQETAWHGISFVAPVLDEAESLERLVQGILSVAPGNLGAEIILVDDGSRDNSWQIILDLRKRLPQTVRGIRLRGNHGKATALQAGFRAARGSVIFTMDADLQDEPAEIPRFLAKLNEGYDLVSGWKQVRHDPWHKVFPSRIFNWLLSLVGGVKLHDQNCGFKCYRRSVVKALCFRGEQHRVLPALAAQHGFRSAEIAVTHHPRRTGCSKYGLERIFRGFCDLLAIGFLKRYRARPSHFVQKLAAGFGLIGATTTLAALANFLAAKPLGAMPVAALLAWGISANLMVQGLLAELFLQNSLSTQTPLPILEDTGDVQTPPLRKRERE